jgi:RNA polymerase sigma-70 factor (ECF subfamily)
MTGQLTTRNYAVIETEDVLLERVRRSDSAAFETLFLRYYPQVFRVLFNLVGTREEAEDLAQETFLALLHQPPAGGRDVSLLAWLCRVALNRGYNALRGRRRAEARFERLAAEPPAQIDPREEALRSEERARVRAAIAELPERQGRLLLLRYAGLSYGEIASTIDVAPGSVGTLLARAERAFVAAYDQFETKD